MSERQYRALGIGGFWHLGSVEGGYRTACGMLLTLPTITLPDQEEIDCLRCGRTVEYRRALASGQVVV